MQLLRKSLSFILALVFFTVQTAWAQQHTPTAAPIPPQIVNAQTVFLSNAGADTPFLAFTDGKDRAYNELYASLKQWGKYRLVSSPSQADLILEVHALAPAVDVPGPNDTTSPVYNPQIRLQFLDPSTHTVLWTLTSYVHAGLGTQSVRDKQFDEASTGLFDQLRQLTGETLTPTEAKETHTRPGVSRGTKVFFVAAAVGGALMVGLLAYHFSHQTAPALPALQQPTLP
jgi:hypothetical protein